MSKASRLLLGLLLVAALLAGPLGLTVGGHAPPGPPGPGELHLALGDSLAVGVGASAPGQRGFVPLLTEWLNRLSPTRPAALRNLSVVGETSQSFLDGGQLVRAEAQLRSAAADGRRVSPVTLSLGGNDLLRAEREAPPARQRSLERFGRNLGVALDRLYLAMTTDGAPAGALILLTVYNPRGGDATIAGSDAWWVEQFNAVIRAAAAERGLVLVDAWAIVAGGEQALTRIGIGDVHPNNAGHLAIAEAAWRALGYDRAAPTVELLAPAPGDLARRVPTVRARAADEVGVKRVELWADGQRVKELTWLPEFGHYAGTWDARALPVGPHQLEVRAVDAAGNTGQAGLALGLR